MTEAVTRRVLHALTDRTDARTLVHEHFDRNRSAVVEAVRDTLLATRQDPDPVELQELVDQGLIDDLRLPDRLPAAWAVRLLRPGVLPAIAVASAVVLGALALLVF